MKENKSFETHPAYQEEDLGISTPKELEEAKEAAGVTTHAEAMTRAKEYAEWAGDVKLNIAAEKNMEEIEKIFSKEVLTEENLDKGNIDWSAMKRIYNRDGTIKYEFELEREFRYIVSPEEVLSRHPFLQEDKNWENHVIDTYDESGRSRIRVKNDKPRLSLKVPLFSKDGNEKGAKVCFRMEFKPDDKDSEDALFKIRDLILEEEKTRTTEKHGHPLVSTDGKKIWLNKGTDEATGKTEYWVETDEAEDIKPFPELHVLRSEKSKIRV